MDLYSSVFPKHSTISTLQPVSSNTSLLKASSGLSFPSSPPPGNLYSFFLLLFLSREKKIFGLH